MYRRNNLGDQQPIVLILRADDELEDEEPELVAFYPECAAREFD